MCLVLVMKDPQDCAGYSLAVALGVVCLSESLEYVHAKFQWLAVICQHFKQERNDPWIVEPLEIHQGVEPCRDRRIGPSLERRYQRLQLIYASAASGSGRAVPFTGIAVDLRSAPILRAAAKELKPATFGC